MAENVTIQQLPQGEDKISKAKRLVDILKNRFLSVTIEDGLTNLEQVEKLHDDIEKAGTAVDKVVDTYEGSDEDLDLLEDLSYNCTAMWNSLNKIIEVFSKQQHLKQNLNLK